MPHYTFRTVRTGVCWQQLFMLKRLFWRASSIGVAVMYLTSCSSGDDAAQDNAHARTAWCQAACDYTARCTQPVPFNCATSLQLQDTAYLGNVTTEFLLAFAACLESAACATDWSTATNNCAQKAATQVTPSTDVINMCKAKAAKFFDCNWQDADLTACTQDYAPLSDTAVQRFSNCSITTCDDLKTCSTAAFSD